MSRYKINANFRHWKKGDILEKYEYNRLPHELKESHCEEVVESVAAPVVAVVAEEVKPRFAAKKIVDETNY